MSNVLMLIVMSIALGCGSSKAKPAETTHAPEKTSTISPIDGCKAKPAAPTYTCSEISLGQDVTEQPGYHKLGRLKWKKNGAEALLVADISQHYLCSLDIAC